MKAYAIMWHGEITGNSNELDIYKDKDTAEACALDREEIVEVEIIIKDKENEK